MTTAEKKDLLLKEWELAGGEKAKKGILKKLSDKYKIPEGTVRRWKSEYLKKNKVNVRNNKKNERTKMANEQELKIKKDILDGVPKEEVMEKYGIGKSSYYNKAKSIRQMRMEATEQQAQKIIEEVYADLPDFLKNIAVAKRNTAIRIVKAINDTDTSDKLISQLDKKLALIIKTEKELMRTGKMLTTFELFGIEAQLVDENIKNEYLQLEKEKLEKAKLEKDESEKEIEMMELLRNITNKVEKNE